MNFTIGFKYGILLGVLILILLPNTFNSIEEFIAIYYGLFFVGLFIVGVNTRRGYKKLSEIQK